MDDFVKDYSNVPFSTLEIGEEFECYGDIHLNYHYSKICKCIKDNNDSAHEIDGINFFIHPKSLVFKINYERGI